ncbi:hypothetical protein [Vibrio sp. 99-8-1]|uniref:hypothetical protein n=1 Tax=Vibrio sp. 99-8-1 TaxID=2607602 RepID=UPI0014935DBA|nr:hypothetical protein [Vibrio sp. 99-8-1]NOI65844.1 hypothetical protein [Vibrio sp. 99-8-1]
MKEIGIKDQEKICGGTLFSAYIGYMIGVHVLYVAYSAAVITGHVAAIGATATAAVAGFITGTQSD